MTRVFVIVIVSLCASAQETEADFTNKRTSEIAPLVGKEKYKEAAAELRVLIAKAREKLPADSLEMSRLLSVYVECVIRLGQRADDDVLDFAQTALRIKEKHLGSTAPETLQAMIRVAGRHVDRYEFDRALRMLERAAPVAETIADSSPSLAYEAQLELAVMHFTAGSYAKAREHSEKSLAIAERHFGADSLETAQALTPLGFAAGGLGDTFGAGVALERCLRIRERVLGPDKRLTIAAMNNLGNYYTAVKQWTRAIEMYERANTARLRLLGPDHPDNAIGMLNLGIALEDTGEWTRARSLFAQALALRARTIGAEHQDYAKAASKLANVLLRLGEPAAARPYAEHAVTVMGKRVPAEHPDAVEARHTLAAILFRLGETAGAFRFAAEGAEHWTAMMRMSAQSAVERNSLSRRESWKDGGQSLATAIAVAAGSAEKRRAMDLWVRSRALVLDEVASRQKILNRAASPEIDALRAKMLHARGRVARLSLQGGAGLDLAKLERDKAERAYAEQNRDTRLALLRAAIGFDQVAKSLRQGEVLVAYAQARNEGEPAPRTVAFVLHAGADAPEMVALGSVREVDRLVKRWRDAIGAVAQDPARAGVRAENVAREAGAALRRLVYDPVAVHLGKARHVFLVAEGSLQLINFQALPAGPGRYLIDGGPLLHMLPAERDLVSVDEEPPSATGLLAMGNPAFNRAATGNATRGGNCASIRSESFESLPSTAVEIRELSRSWADGKAEVVQGAQATEAAFRQRASGKRVVHVATHGFFLGDDCAKDGGLLVASGLVLAAERGDDGLLTAEEVAGLNLDGVEWVVLSGCETGLGQVSGGEGVVGLRRSFQAAGASTVIMSLWAVGDRSALEWMRALYAARFKRGLSTPESLRAAGREMLAARRKAGLSTHPYFWAAFVGTGAK